LATGQGDASLSVSVFPSGQGQSLNYTLECRNGLPAGGTAPDSAAACAVVLTNQALFQPAALPSTQMCAMHYGGPEKARVLGTIAGKSVNASFDRTNGCGIATWATLAPLLGSTSKGGA
jgi:hypothetical protein